MHTLLGLSSVLWVILGGYLTLAVLLRVSSWSQRRGGQLLALMVPLVSLGLGIGDLHHFMGRACLSRAPSWDALLGMALPLGMLLLTLGAFGLGLLRVFLMARAVTHSGIPAGPKLQALADDLAERLGAVRPRVLLRFSDRPLACTSGLFRPTVLLSTWMVEQLDRRELEAVLAHELEHVARRDYLVVWLATVLRDAFFYLPTSWAAYRQLQQEKELACDDLAVAATHRPLALASALGKVWQHGVEGHALTRFGIAQSLTAVSESINGRIERLLTTPKPAASTASPHAAFFRFSIPALVGLLLLEAVNVTLILALMGCGPALLLGKLF